MISFRVSTGGLGVRLPAMGKYMSDRASQSVVHHTQLLRTRVMAKASGRPGPNAPTGDYRRSISMRVERGAWTTGHVGTNKPQGRRLELGFVGPDSLGRHFPYRPYPHFGPAMDEIGPEFVRDLEDIVSGVVKDKRW